MKKINALIGLSLLLTLACGREGKGSSARSGVEELTFRITWAAESGRGQAIQKIVDAFNSQSQGAQVRLLGGNESLEEIITSDAHIFQMPYRYVKSLAEQGLFGDLKGDLDKEASYFYDAISELGMYNGMRYGVPWIGHSMAIIYNQNLLGTAGVDPLAIVDWKSFEEALRMVQANTSARGIGIVGAQHTDVSWMASMFIYSFGGQLVDSQGKVVINSPEAAEGLDYYFKTLSQYAQVGWEEHNGGGVMEAFRSGEVAFQIQGPWGVTDIWKQDEERRFPVGTIPLSQIKHNGVPGHSEIGPYMLTLSGVLSEDQRAAGIRFLKFLVSKEAQEMVMAGEYDERLGAYFPFRVPLRKDMQDASIFQENPEFFAFIQGFEYPSIEAPTGKWSEVREKYVLPNFNAIATGVKTVEQALADIEEGAQLIMP